MTPEQAAHELAPVVVGVPGRFMTDPDTFAHGATLGFEGMDFYIGGRGGPLGDVDADVVTAALVFFAPDVVRPAWDRAGAIMTRPEAAIAWVQRGHAWADEHFADGPESARVAALLEPVVRDASVAAAPLFAGLRTVPEPVAPKALALHRLYELRELRGARHGAAVLTVGLSPAEAIAVRSPAVASLFGWGDASPDPAPLRDRWQLAEARTDRMLGRALTVLDPVERAELVDLAQGMMATLAT